MQENSRYLNRNVIATLEYPPMVGGIATYVVEMEKQLKKSRVLYIKGIPNWRDAFWKLLPARKANRIIVHHVFPLGTAALAIRLLYRTPYSVVFHGKDYDVARRSPLRRIILSIILKFAEHVVTNSKALASELSQEFNIQAKTVHPVLPNPVYRSAGSVNCKQLPQHKDGTLRILTVGRLVDRKNQQAVVKILPMLPDNVHYDIVGDGENRTYLSELARQLGVSDRVHLHGSCKHEDLPKFYRNCDVFVALSTKKQGDREGFGIVYLEAQYFCRPVLAYDQQGVREALSEDAVIFTSKKNLAKDLINLFSDPEKRLSMGRSGHSFVQNHFLPATMGETLNKLFD